MSRPLAAMDRLRDQAEGRRKVAGELAEGIENLMARFRALDNVPLDVLDKVERSIVQTHTDNLLKLTSRPPRSVPSWAVSALHDLGCSGPDACVCEPIYMAAE